MPVAGYICWVTIPAVAGGCSALASDGVWQLGEHTFRYQGAGAFASLRNPELHLQFGAGGDHAATLSLILSARAFGDAVYQDRPS